MTETDYKTRNLTVEESATLVRNLHLTLGRMDLVNAALRVVADLGAGIFMAEETPKASVVKCKHIANLGQFGQEPCGEPIQRIGNMWVHQFVTTSDHEAVPPTGWER